MQSLSLPQKAGESSTRQAANAFFMEETVIYLQQTA